MRFSSNRRLALLICAAALCSAALGQETTPPAGPTMGNYQILQTYDMGYRYANVYGSQANYATLVNIGSGPRLLNSLFDAHAMTPAGAWFDNLNLTTMGLGGDPQQTVRLFVDKSRVYTFTASYRRDYNVFNYNLLSNPLNPTTFTPATGVGSTLHELSLSRRMQDYDLMLLPQSTVSFRLGYSNNSQGGPATSTLHGNVDTQLFENYSTTMNSYRFGVDYKPFARTIISYTQFLEYFKNDTSDTGVPTNYQLSNGQLSNGVPVDLGFVYTGTTPCATVIANAAATPATATATCPAYLSYSRVAPSRTSLPTENAHLHSNYWKELDINGSFSYNTGQNSVPLYTEIANGLTSRPDKLTRGTDTTATTAANRVQVSGDGTAIWSPVPEFKAIDIYALNRFESPGDYAYTAATQFAQGPVVGGSASLLSTPAVFNATNCPAPYAALTCPQHAAGSAADLETGITYTYLADHRQANTTLLNYDFTPSWSGHIGYRRSWERVSDGSSSFITSDLYDPGSGAALADRGNCALSGGKLPATCTLNANGSATYTPTTVPTVVAPAQVADILGNSILVGMSFHAGTSLRIASDNEFYNANHSFDRIDPRRAQHVTLRAEYTPLDRLHLDFSLADLESQDNSTSVDQNAHTRVYSGEADFDAGEKLTLELGYTYNDLYSQANVCFSLGTSPVPAGVGACPIAGSPVTQGALGFYSDLDHFYDASFNFKPNSRVSVRGGYLASYTRGSTLMLNPLAPQGPLQYDYPRPFGEIDVTAASHLTLHAGLNYYDYRELGTVNIAGLAPIFGDNFHSEVLTTSVRYSF